MRARVVGILTVAIAAYFAYVTMRGTPAAFACAVGAGVLAVVFIAVFWKRPALGATLAVAVVVGSLIAQGSVFRGPHALNSNVPAPTGTTALSSATLSAPQTSTDFSEFLGPGTVASEDAAETVPSAETKKSGNAVLSAFGGGEPTATPASADAAQLRDFAAQIPEKEYSLDALSQTLSNDPVELYRFVRDNVDLDLYDGVMRGPIGTWLGRAGSPADKTMLLAWLFAKKGVHFQFVRATLSDDERNQIATASAAVTLASPDPLTAKKSYDYIVPLLAKAQPFASWAEDRFSAARVATASLPKPADRIGTRHYWLQVENAGKTLDLDPTLASMHEGQHLGAFDNSFKPSVLLPPDDFHWIALRLVALRADGSSTKIMTYTGRIEDVAYAPLRVAVIPRNVTDISGVASATQFDTYVFLGKQVAIGKFDLGDGGASLDQLVLEIAREGPGFPQETSRRWLLPRGVPASQRSTQATGVTTLVVVPGVATNAYALRQRFLAIARAFEDYQQRQSGATPKPHVTYPVRILDFFARDEAVAARLPLRLYRNRPNIVAQRSYVTAVDGGAPDFVNEFDIVDNTMSSSSDDAKAIFSANLQRGYIDTAIERDVSPSANPYGAAGFLDAADSAGASQDVIVKPPAASSALQLGLKDTVGNGRVAIAPTNPIQYGGRLSYGWWDVDPQSGNTVGRMTGGRGVSMGDYGIMIGYAVVLSAGYLRVLNDIESFPECRPGGGSASACATALCKAEISSMLDGSMNVRGLLTSLGATLARFGYGFSVHAPCGA